MMGAVASAEKSQETWKWGRGHTSKQIVQPSAVVQGEDIVDDSIRNELSETEKEQLD